MRLDRKDMHLKINAIISDISTGNNDEALKALNLLSDYFDDTDNDYMFFKDRKLFKIVMILDYLVEKRPVLYKAVRYYTSLDNEIKEMYTYLNDEDKIILHNIYFKDRQTNYEDISLDRLKKLQTDMKAIYGKNNEKRELYNR